MAALMNAVNGLCTTIDIMLHPPILSADRVPAMLRHLLYIYPNTNGKATPDQMADLFVISMQKQVEDIRSFDFDGNAAIHALSH